MEWRVVVSSEMVEQSSLKDAQSKQRLVVCSSDASCLFPGAWNGSRCEYSAVAAKSQRKRLQWSSGDGPHP